MLPDEPSEEERRLAPEAPDIPDADDAPADLKRQFWRLVVLFNLALLACSLGLLLAVFESRLRDGGALLVLGIGVFAYGLRDYRRVTTEIGSENSEDDDEKAKDEGEDKA